MKNGAFSNEVLFLSDEVNHSEAAYRNNSLSTSERVEDLLQRMTLDEKIGQMTQLDITLINTSGKQKDVKLDEKKARNLIRNHHIGSFLNGEAVSQQEWYRFMSTLTRIMVEETRLGIPILYGIDHIHGASYLKNATIFPQSINLGATFDPSHAFQTGWVTALETADLGHHWAFSPVLDLGANPAWPRFFETYGEDPLLCGMMGAAHVQGYQNNEAIAPYKLSATGKHFLGYSDPRSGWDRTPAHLSMQQIQEFHRPSFQKAIDAGLRTIMVNSGEINGIPVHASHQILKGLLRDQMGFEGVIVTDWDDIGKLVNFHYTAENFKEATYAAISAGIDMSMTPLHLKFNTSLRELVEEGRIHESRLDESVRRILTLKFDLGLFENPYPRNDRFERIGSPSNKNKALATACDSIVLLKNDNHVLPATRPARIGVFGISANSKRNLCGGWTIAWQGGEEERFPDEMQTIYTALKSEYPSSEVILYNSEVIPVRSADSLSTEIYADSDIPTADISSAKKSPQPHTDSLNTEAFLEELGSLDLIVYAGGEEPYCEFAGNINDLRLPQKQLDEINLLSKAKAPLVLILVEGRPRVLSGAANDADAIIFAGLPGFEGAEAIARVISGRTNPGGRLPFSYPKHPNHYLAYNHKRSDLYFFDPKVANHIVQGNRSSSLFPFGHGLSYTTFEYANLRLSSDIVYADGSITATVDIKNTGSRAGKHAALWFLTDEVGSITRPVKQLAHFGKFELSPGETVTAEFVIRPGESLWYPDETGRKILEAGRFTLRIGELEAGFHLK